MTSSANSSQNQNPDKQGPWTPVALSLYTCLAAVGLLVASRLLPHVNNFSLINASCLLAGAALASPWRKLAIPFLAVWLSDFALNNFIYPEYYQTEALHLGAWTLLSYQALWQFGAYALIVLIGFLSLRYLRSPRLVKPSDGRFFALTLSAAALASISFFLISNFSVWLYSTTYSADFAGLISCYVAGLPFYQATLLSDLVFTPLGFAAWYAYSSLNEQKRIAGHLR